MNNILMEELLAIQTQYKEILISAKKKLSSTLPNEVLNEITSFWYRNRNIVNCALNWLSYSPFNTYLFTAAVNLDVDEKDHYPFVLMGAAHVLDDPVFKFATTAPATSEFSLQFLDYQKKLVMEAIEDNIKILENFQGRILVIPVSFMFDDLEMIKALADNAFLGFFNDSVSDLEEIKQRCNTFEDVEALLNAKTTNQIILNGFDDFKIGLRERFEEYKDYQNEYQFSDKFSEASSFLFALYSHILNASRVISICTMFSLTPYLRYDVVFHYYTLILGSVLTREQFSEMAPLLSKVQISYTVCQVINRDLFVNINFNEFLNFCRNFNFESKLADKQKRLSEGSEKISLVSAVADVLNDFYKFCGIVENIK